MYEMGERKFPGAAALQDEYYRIKDSGGDTAAFLDANPMLRRYWAWRAEYRRSDPCSSGSTAITKRPGGRCNLGRLLGHAQGTAQRLARASLVAPSAHTSWIRTTTPSRTPSCLQPSRAWRYLVPQCRGRGPWPADRGPRRHRGEERRADAASYEGVAHALASH
jgi:hypothetical protein